MQVLLTIVLIGIAAAAFVALQQRLQRMKQEVKAAWKLLESNQTNEAAKVVYNKRVAAYNTALQVFPSNIVAALTGFKPAKPFN
jgi:hypothetical protein